MTARIVILAWVFLLFVSTGRSQEKEKDVYGTFQSIDVEKGTITVTLPPNNKAQTFNFSKRDIPIRHPLGKALKFENLQPKSRLNLKLNAVEDVVSMRDESDCDWGVVVSVDPDKDEFQARFSVGVARILKAKDFTFLFNGDPGSVRNLKPLQVVKVILGSDRKKILEVQAGKGIGFANPYCRLINQSGYLLKKDDAQKIIQLGTIGDRTRLMDFTYDSWTGVRLVYSTYLLRTTSMDVVNSPAKLNLYFESDRQRVSSLSVDVPLISRCLVKSYDKEKRTLTILADQEENSETFPIAADVTVVRDGLRVDLLKEKMENRVVTLGLSLDQKEIIFVNLLLK